ncbi:hypothetical protein C8J57DRAFT_1358377 [Mycena rebaudengoi]|nr:hypothetical protein C8J57DRAFT_1358377 [Mycena rebaudengoi]
MHFDRGSTCRLPQMCFVWLFGHNCWQYNEDLSMIFPAHREHLYLNRYRYYFLSDIHRAPTIAETQVRSVLYCRTRGPTAYPFLVVQLRHPRRSLDVRPVLLKLEGFDGPLQEREEREGDERSTVTIAGYGQSVRGLVGTRRYDVCHTMECPRGRIADLLVLAELSTEQDHTTAIFAATLFLAIEYICDGVVTSSTKRRARAAPLPSDVAKETLGVVRDAFFARRRKMQDEIDIGEYGCVLDRDTYSMMRHDDVLRAWI